MVRRKEKEKERELAAKARVKGLNPLLLHRIAQTSF
jgi:hypothetical protein